MPGKKSVLIISLVTQRFATVNGEKNFNLKNENQLVFANVDVPKGHSELHSMK